MDHEEYKSSRGQGVGEAAASQNGRGVQDFTGRRGDNVSPVTIGDKSTHGLRHSIPT